MDFERGIMFDRKKNIIGIIGIGPEAGATLVASGLAIILAKGEVGAAYVQEGDGYKTRYNEKYKSFDRLSLQSEFGKKKMYDLYHLRREGINIEARANLFNRVNWVVRVPIEYRKPITTQGRKPKDSNEKHLPYSLIGGRNIVVDTPADIYAVDRLVCVIDPLPSKIKSALDIFTEIKELEKTRPKGHVVWVINKYNPHVNKTQLEKFLQIKTDCMLELIEPEVFFSAEYSENMPILEIQSRSYIGQYESFLDGLNQIAKMVSNPLTY